MESPAKKRKKSLSPTKETNDGPNKKTKKDEFTEIDFKLWLQNPNTTFTALEQFVRTARSWSPGDGYDIVNGYCRTSGDCAEIFQILDAGKRKSQEICTIFAALEAILLRIIDDLDRYTFIGQTIVQKILSSHMPQLYFCLNANNKSMQIKTTLRLLTAMVMINEGTAKSVLAQFDFNHSNIFPLFNRRDTKDPKDVRTCLVHFIMSFLLSGSDTVIKQLIEQRGVISKLFKGMQYDHVTTIQLVLNTLLDKVVLNKTIAKTLKMKIFGEQSLKQLSLLFQWRGPSRWKTELHQGKSDPVGVTDHTSAEKEDSKIILEIVHKLFQELLCSFKNGINFYDKTFGTSGKNHNPLITSLLTSLTSVEQPLITEIIVKTLVSCPDQLGYYLPTMLNSLTPRPSEKWILTMGFLSDVYENQPEFPPCLNSKDRVSIHKLVQMLLVFVLPPQKVINTIMQAAKHKHTTVRHTLLNLVKLILHRTTVILKYIQDKHGEFHQVYTAAEILDIIQLFKESILKAVPDTRTLMSCWDKLGISPTDTKPDVDMDEDVHKDIQVVDPIVHMITIEQVLCLYQELSPLFLVDNPTDISKLMEGVKKEVFTKDQSQDETDDDVANENEFFPQLLLLKLLSGTDARKLPWGKPSTEGHTLMYLLLEMMSKIKDDTGQPSLVQITQQLVCQLLCRTGLFEGKKDELMLWLKHYVSFVNKGDCDQAKLTETLAAVFSVYINNPYPYIDKVSDFMSEVVAMGTGESKMETASIGTNESAIDGILEMDEEELQEEFIISEMDSTICKDIILPFTPLAIIALEYLSKSQDSVKGFVEYLSCALLDIFHTQIDPLPFVCMIHSCGKLVDNKVRKYMLSWLPTEKKKPKIPDSSILSHLNLHTVSLMKMYMELDSNTVRDLHENVTADVVNPEDAMMTVKHCLMYIQTYLNGCDKVSKMKIVSLQALYDVIRRILNTWMKKLNEKEDKLDLSEELEQSDGPEQSGVRSKEFTMLYKVQEEPSDICFEIIKCILDHPVNRKWYLCQTSSEVMITKVTAMDTTLMKEISNCVTEKISQIFSEIQNVDFGSKRELVIPYFVKLRNYLSDITETSDVTDNNKILEDSVRFIFSHVDHYQELSLLTTLLNLPLVVCKARHSKELSHFAAVIVSVVEKLISLETSISLQLSLVSVGKLFDLLVDLNNNKLDSVCLKFLSRFSLFSVIFEQKNLNYLLEYPSSDKLKMAAIVISHNSIMRKCFENWIMGHLTDENKMEYLSVIIAYSRSIIMSHDLGASTRTKKCLKTVCDVYKEEFKSLHTDQEELSLKCSLLCNLVDLKCLGKNLKQKIVQSITKAIDQEVPITSHHIEVLSKLLHCNGESGEEENTHLIQRKTLFLACKKCFIQSVSKKQARQRKLEECCVKIFSDFCQSDLQIILSEDADDDWSTFVKCSLRNYYRDPKMLSFLEILVRLMYTDDQGRQLTADLLFEMVTSHSLYLQIMFGEVYPEAKSPLIDLLTAVVEVKPDCCTTQHVGILLGAYGATLSLTDQKILRLIQIFENNGASMSEYRPFLWGTKAVEQHSIRKSLGPSLWKQPSLENILEILDQSKLYKSILKFPLRKKLSPSLIQSCKDCKSEEDVYDPCFMLPLLSNLMSPDSLLDCRKIVESNCLGYVIAAISSHDTAARGAAYHILAAFLHHLEGARFQEKDQVLYLMQLLQRSIEKPNNKLACIITIFLAKAVKILLKPGDHMYQLANSFLLLKPSLDILNVPEFYKLFNSSALEFKEERGWMLNLLSEGLRETADYRIFEKRYIFKLLLGYYDSSISDSHTQNQVLKIVCAACKEKTAALDLAKNHGILSWLSSVLSHRDISSLRVVSIIDIVNSLWFSMLGDKEAHNKSEETKRCLPLIFSQEVLLVLQALLGVFREDPSPKYRIKFLETLISVLRHIQLTVEVLTAQGHVIHPVTLTLRDVCLLMILTSRKDSLMLNVPYAVLDSLGVKCKSQIKGNKPSSVVRPKVNLNGSTTNQVDTKDNTESTSEQVKSSVCSSSKASSLAVSVCQYWVPWQHQTGAQTNLDCDAAVYAGFLSTSIWMLQQKAVTNNIADILQVLQWINKALTSNNKYVEILKEILSLSSMESRILISELVNIYTVVFNHFESRDQMRVKLSTFSRVLECLNTILWHIAEHKVTMMQAVREVGELQRIIKEVQELINSKGDTLEDVSLKLREFFLTSLEHTAASSSDVTSTNGLFPGSRKAVKRQSSPKTTNTKSEKKADKKKPKKQDSN